MTEKTKIETAVFGGGCFWCTEAVFDKLKGIISIAPGYAGGSAHSITAPGGEQSQTTSSPQVAPTYEEVCTGKTGHAEVIKIEFDPSRISYKELLTVFFATHNPTTPNRQGDDVGEQYRSIILYATDEQKREAEAVIKTLNASTAKGNPVVTEVKPLEKFYEAEGYHHSYYRKNYFEPYCQVVIEPKLEKVQKEFAELLKKTDYDR